MSWRALEDDLRLAAVTDHSQDSLDGLKRSVISACEEAAAEVGNIVPKDLSRPGRRESNPMTAGDVIQYVARHVRDHANQISEARRLIRQQQ